MSKATKKMKFKRNDFLRVLLTDTLPYEVPLLFSNYGYYRRLREKADSTLRENCKLDLLPKNKWAVPYSYNVRKDSLDFRTLSVAHPAVQRDFCEIYEKYGQLIIGLCSRSKYSLRYPVKVATRYYERLRVAKSSVTETAVEVEEDGFSQQERHASSFFSYQRYNLIHKFYESPAFHELEKKFKYLRRLDISKCFNHIYTHSISWAAKNKEYGKEFKGPDTFEGQFDHLMQLSNYNETNGIIIGPEISRIFAEVILQSIDVSVDRILLMENYLAGRDYDIRRYVDDYFVFATDDRLLDTIQSTLAKQLSRFKLYLNAAKTSSQRRPFVTGQTGAKIELASLVDRIFAQHTRNAKEMRVALKQFSEKENGGESAKPFAVKYVGNAAALAAGYIRDIKQIVIRSQADFDSISNYFFSIVSRKTIGLINRIKTKECDSKQLERLTRFLRAILDLVFFVYAMSPRVRATYQVSALCYSLSESCNLMPKDSREFMKGLMSDHMRAILREAVDGGEGDNIEIVNLLTVLHSFGDQYLLTQSELLHIYGLELDEQQRLRTGRSTFGYFQIVTLLHYIAEIPSFARLREAISQHVQDRFDTESLDSIQRNSELTMLAFDYMRCPYISQTRKELFARELLKKHNSDNLKGRVPLLLDVVNKGDWFFSWHMRDALGELLWKKELRTAY
ncbi:antiviral reverse transcriptase Drt3b [Burkholderia cepacia]|uniref:antiviral reverse transcriptase Drt3b n=1 Tax=Burkholderia cepacia TaxID=292 RepID=UPI003B569956